MTKQQIQSVKIIIEAYERGLIGLGEARNNLRLQGIEIKS